MKLLIAGDFSPKYRTIEHIEEGNADFLFEKIKPIIEESDYSILNFETVVADSSDKPIYKCGPNLSCTPKAVDLIKRIGFDCVTLANNHFRDFGDSAIAKTIRLFDERELDYVGGGINLAESQRVLIKHFGDVKVSIVNICESEFSIAKSFRAGSAPIDTFANYMQIKEAKQKADKVVVIIHGGHEHFRYPSKRMKYLYRYFVEIGADAVINHHQHCFSGYETYNDSPIVYGLGNFMFDNPKQRNSDWNNGYLVRMNVEIAKPITFDVLPYTQCNENPTISLLSGQDLIEFQKTVSSINDVILDDNALEQKFSSFMKRKKRAVIAALAPYSNDYVRAVAGRGWIPQFLSKSRAACLYNYLICESQRDCTLKFLEYIINK